MRVKALQQAGKYSSLPAQRKNAQKFLAFVGEAEQILQALRHLGYQYDGPDPSRYVIPSLPFWGLLLIALLAPLVRTELLRDILDGGFDIPRRPEQLALLGQTVQAAAVRPADEPELIALIARLPQG